MGLLEESVCEGGPCDAHRETRENPREQLYLQLFAEETLRSIQAPGFLAPGR